MSFDLELVDSDLKIKADGTMSILTDTPKLRQDILKIILTPLGSNRFHPWYGCSITDAVSGRSLPDNMMVEEIKSTVNQSLERLKTLQKAQASGQAVTLAEIISVIDNVTSNRDPVDPRQVNIIVTVLTRRLTKVEEVFTVIS